MITLQVTPKDLKEQICIDGYTISEYDYIIHLIYIVHYKYTILIVDVAATIYSNFRQIFTYMKNKLKLYSSLGDSALTKGQIAYFSDVTIVFSDPDFP